MLIYKVVMWMYTTFLSRMHLTFSYELLHWVLRGFSKSTMKLSTVPCIMKLHLYFSHAMLFLGRALLDDVDLNIICYNSFQVCLLWQICNSKTGIMFRRCLYMHSLLALSIYEEITFSKFTSPKVLSLFSPHMISTQTQTIQNLTCSKTGFFL